MNNFWYPTSDRDNEIYVVGRPTIIGMHWSTIPGRRDIYLCRLDIEKDCPMCEANKRWDQIHHTEPGTYRHDRPYPSMTKWALPVVPLKDAVPVVRLYPAPRKVCDDIFAWMSGGPRILDIRRYGQGFNLEYRVRAPVHNASMMAERLQKVIDALIGVATMPTVQYPPREEIDAMFRMGGFTYHLIDLDEPWANTDDYANRIPFDQGANTPYKAKPTLMACMFPGSGEGCAMCQGGYCMWWDV